MKPTLIVVSGMWASGKTTLAHRLAANLGWPLIYRDGLKESFFDAVGEASQEVLDKLGPASYGIMFHIPSAGINCAFKGRHCERSEAIQHTDAAH